jgi:hypothetical protein
MPVRQWIRILGIVLLAAGFGAGVVSAQDGHAFSASLAGGFAGAFDLDDDRDFEHPVVQVGFGMYTDHRTLTVVRVGRFAFDSRQGFGGLVDAEVDYVNVAGEYRFRQAAYDFGLFVGVGGYRLDGLGGAGREEQTVLGAAIGFTGDFDLTRRLSFIAEIDLHYAFFDDTNFYGAALAGLALHF